MLEKDLQQQIMDFAEMNGWLRMHQLPARTGTGGWATAVQGDVGFPDLVLVRPPRMIVVELKQDGRYPGPEQRVWLEALAEVPGIETGVWRPKDWPQIEAALRRDPRADSYESRSSGEGAPAA
ncbi:MAG: hypothetical protein AAGA90_21535 [Actinomycetota bacterium]